MPEIRVIVVPYELGRLRDGVGCGPERLLQAGAADALASAGAAVEVDVVEIDERFAATGSGEVDAAFELMRQVADRVRSARADDAFPLILSGSCFVAVGVVAHSEPPAKMMSASPYWMARIASPMACVEVVQALTTPRFGPRSPKRMLRWPATMLPIVLGM